MRRAAVAGGLLVLAGCGTSVIALVSIGSGHATPSLVNPGRSNQPINAGALNRTDLSAHNSPSLAANPLDAGDLVVTNRIDLPLFGCAMHHSTDGGATWSVTRIPLPAGEEPKCYAPDVAFGADGTLYATFVTLHGIANEPNAVWLTTSTDGGRTLSSPTAITGPHAYQVRLATDPESPRRLYVSWLLAAGVGNLSFTTPGNPILVVRSDDGGVTWSRPVAVTPLSRQRALAPSIVVGPGGVAYVLYLDLKNDELDYAGAHGGEGGEPYAGSWALVLARSQDAGSSWSERTVDDALTPTDRLIVFLPPFPSLAVDRRSGRLYAAFEDGRDGDADVVVWTSGDGGQSFGPARRVNDTPRHDGTSQYRPRLAVAPNGRLDVLYYDRRDDRSNVLTGVSLQSSDDQAANFGPHLTVSDRSFDSRVGFGSERHLADLGSRLALLSTDTGALAVWSDTRAGTATSGKQDLARAVIAFTTPRSPRGWVAAAGAVVAGVGVLLLATAAVTARRRGRAPA